MKNLLTRREQLLQQMAQCDTMEYGSLKAERRPVVGGGLSRPYFKHQVWEGGRNLSQRIPGDLRLEGVTVPQASGGLNLNRKERDEARDTPRAVTARD